MASVTKTTTSTGETRYRVRYRNPGGKDREKWFGRKVDADKFARNIETDKDRDEFIDPRSGRITVADWVEEVESAKGIEAGIDSGTRPIPDRQTRCTGVRRSATLLYQTC